eukprot:NODE_181_length_13917_cov_0.838110.p7 type:complete len:287 gc:universal NODE_181_length_13917_cov_0.838110:8371-7511(-)
MPVNQKQNSLETQILNFHKDFARSTKKEVLERQQILAYFVQKIEYFYKLKVELFGSISSNTALPYSDIDLNVTVDKTRSGKDSLVQLLSDIPKKLDGWNYNLLKDAKIPVLTMHKKSFVVQLTCNTDGVAKGEFMKKFIDNFPKTRLIIQLLKHFLHEHDLDSIKNGGLNTYCISVMMIALFHQFTDLSCSTSYSKLLTRFLEFYCCLNWSNALITSRGVYFNEKQVGLFIEDPMEYGRNLSHSSWQIDRVRELFNIALENLHKAGHFPGFLKLTRLQAMQRFEKY